MNLNVCVCVCYKENNSFCLKKIFCYTSENQTALLVTEEYWGSFLSKGSKQQDISHGGVCVRSLGSSVLKLGLEDANCSVYTMGRETEKLFAPH